LSGVILLPRSTLPLNVFEPRYLAMVDDALAGNRIIGIVQPEPGSNPDVPLGNTVALRDVGTFGRITAFSETDDGRCLITLAGIARFDLGKSNRRRCPIASIRSTWRNMPTISTATRAKTKSTARAFWQRL
jgi:Lon protease-like protein